MVGANGGNQFRQYAGQNVGYQNEYNAVQNVGNQVVQDAVQNQGVQNIGNQNGGKYQGEGMRLSSDSVLIAQKDEAGIQLQPETSTSVTQTDKAPVYDSDGSAELLEPNPEPPKNNRNDSNIISDFSIVEQEGGTVDQHPATVEETRAYFESLYNNLALEVEKVDSLIVYI
ncbi:hypothetical protein Tco_0421980 [Tanacetum coccineum]